jgi:pimeloyl-ACP methyl ester carboxylesterase
LQDDRVAAGVAEDRLLASRLPQRFAPDVAENLGMQRHTAPVPVGMGDPVFVLIHSPLVGPTTWLPVADELVRRRREAVVPSLLGVAAAPAPQWRHVPEAVRAATAETAAPVVLVGHSGAGLLLPVIAAGLAVHVAALVFVDSFLPPASGSLRLAPAGLMSQLRALASDGMLPPWSSWFGEDAMRQLVPEERLRATLEEMPRLPLSYFEASVPVPDGWSACPCAYLLFSGGSHANSAARACDHGWAVAEMAGLGHLAMASDAIPVTDALLDLELALSGSG